MSEPAVPELPEVETVRRGLAPALTGRRIAGLEVRRPDLRFPLPERFAERVAGSTVRALSRRAKYLIAELSSGDDLVMHLGMTGRFTVHDELGRAEVPGAYVYEIAGDPAHDHIVLNLEGGTRVVYNDPRRFGFMLLIPHAERARHPLFSALGPEPVGDALTAEYLAARAQDRKINLKSFLMDQRTVAGLGNIYVSEALWRARLSPNRTARTLANRAGRPTEHAVRLVQAIRAVIDAAIRAGGSTLRDYRHTDGATGSFQESFAVYDRDGGACTTPGCAGTVRRVIHTGRATFYCPKCQR